MISTNGLILQMTLGLLGLGMFPLVGVAQQPAELLLLRPLNNAQQEDAQQIPRVYVQLQLNPREFPQQQREAWRSALQQLLVNNWGEAVELSVSVTEAPATPHPNPPAVLPESTASASHQGDTVIELSLQGDERWGVWQIRSRRWLRLTASWTTLPEATVRNRSLIPQFLAEAALRLFSPVMKVERVEGLEVTGLVHGGEFPSPLQQTSSFQAGDLLQVLLIYADRKGDVAARQPLQWTYLRVTESQRANVTAETMSAFRNPIPQARRRVEVYAWRVSAVYPQSRLQISQHGSPPQPATFQQVLFSPWDSSPSPAGEAAVVAPLSLEKMTNRRGELELNTAELQQKLGSGVLKMEVLRGTAVVARLPWLPGSAENVAVQVPDTAAQWDAEWQLEQLKTRLLLVAAKRATCVAALQKLAQDPRDLDAEPLRQELRQLLTARKEFLQEIQTIRVTAGEELKRLGNHTAARQVESACQQTALLVERHLSEAPLEGLNLSLPAEKQPTQTDSPQQES